MTIRTNLSAIALLLVVLATAGVKAVETVFDALIPPSCVSPQLQNAGFCVVQKGCASQCFALFGRSSSFSLGSQGLSNFYIPNDAVDCDEFEDPICPATDCCPMCRDELNDLYRCIIMEGNNDIPVTLPMHCELDCQGQIGGNTGFVPTDPDDDGAVIDEVDVDSNSTDFDNDTEWESLVDEEEEDELLEEEETLEQSDAIVEMEELNIISVFTP